MAQIELRGISKTYADSTVVEDVNLVIEDGEFVVLLGPSGCGKTTTLRIIAGLERQTTGELYFDERSVSDEPPIHRNVGMVFQNYALYPHMTVADNLAFGLQSRQRNGSRREARIAIRQRVDKVAELLEITHVLSHRPKELSGGQKQRVALGRALIREPEVFLMDEPLSNLDANLRDRVRMELLKLRNTFPVTTVYVTHDQGEALTLASRVVVMNEGRICQVAPPSEVYDAPASTFVASFVGSPGMNVWTLPTIPTGAHPHSPWGPIKLGRELQAIASEVEDGVVVGIRPEHLTLAPQHSGEGTVIDMQVDIVERLGSHLLVHGSLAEPSNEASLPSSSAVVARLDARLQVEQGDRLKLTAPADRVHLFSQATGLRINHARTCARVQTACTP